MLAEIGAITGVTGLLLGLFNLFQQYMRPFDVYAVIGQRLVFEVIRFTSPGLVTSRSRVDCACVVSLTNRGARGGGVHHLGLRLRSEKDGDFWVFTANDFLKPEALGPAQDFLARFTSFYLAPRETKQFHIALQQPGFFQENAKPFECGAGRYLGEFLVSVDGRSWKTTHSFSFTIVAEQLPSFSATGMLSTVTDEQVQLGRALRPS